MRSLTLKLTLAFLLVGLTGVVLVALGIRERTRSAFDTFLLNRDQQTLVENLLEYYQAAGSWQNVANNGRLHRQPAAPFNDRKNRRRADSYTLVDVAKWYSAHFPIKSGAR